MKRCSARHKETQPASVNTTSRCAGSERPSIRLHLLVPLHTIRSPVRVCVCVQCVCSVCACVSPSAVPGSRALGSSGPGGSRQLDRSSRVPSLFLPSTDRVLVALRSMLSNTSPSGLPHYDAHCPSYVNAKTFYFLSFSFRLFFPQKVDRPLYFIYVGLFQRARHCTVM